MSSTALLFGQNWHIWLLFQKFAYVDTGAMRYIITEATTGIGSIMFHVNVNLYTVELKSWGIPRSNPHICSAGKKEKSW